MWKSVRVLLVASAAACPAIGMAVALVDVSAGPTKALQIEKDIGDGVPAVRSAQFVQEQHATNVPQIFYNIVTDGGACNGDMVTATRPVTIAKGSRVLAVSADTFTSGDVGKAIVHSGGRLQWRQTVRLHTTFTDAQHVTLNRNAETTLQSVADRHHLRDRRRTRFHGVQQMGACKSGNKTGCSDRSEWGKLLVWQSRCVNHPHSQRVGCRYQQLDCRRDGSYDQ